MAVENKKNINSNSSQYIKSGGDGEQQIVWWLLYRDETE